MGGCSLLLLLLLLLLLFHPVWSLHAPPPSFFGWVSPTLPPPPFPFVYDWFQFRATLPFPFFLLTAANIACVSVSTGGRKEKMVPLCVWQEQGCHYRVSLGATSGCIALEYMFSLMVVNSPIILLSMDSPYLLLELCWAIFRCCFGPLLQGFGSPEEEEK